MMFTCLREKKAVSILIKLILIRQIIRESIKIVLTDIRSIDLDEIHPFFFQIVSKTSIYVVFLRAKSNYEKIFLMRQMNCLVFSVYNDPAGFWLAQWAPLGIGNHPQRSPSQKSLDMKSKSKPRSF